MKNIFYKTFLVCLLACVGLTTSAYDFAVDGIYYNKLDDSSVEVTNDSDNPYSGSVVIPSVVTYNENEYAVTGIGSSAFKGCTGLTEITIPSSVTSIGSSAFYDCTSLTSVIIPNGVTSIEYSAFRRCTGLTEITIPSGVTSIGNDAFAKCTNLKTVYMNPTTPPTCGKSCFYSIASDHVIWVSKDSYNAYISSDWNAYNIQALDESAINGVEMTNGMSVADCYDLQGRKLNAPATGINIIKYSDGKARKVYVK